MATRGLTNQEKLGVNVASMTATGLQSVVSAPCLVYSIILSAPDTTERQIARIADASASGSSASLALTIGSGGGVSAGVHEITRQLSFNPPIHFQNGVFVSATGSNSGVVSVVYMTTR